MLLLLVLILVASYLIWARAHIPNPVLYFHQPKSKLGTISKPEDWPTYAGNSQHTRHNPQNIRLKGEIKWEMTLQESTYSEPAVVDGILYVGEYKIVHALEASTGELIGSYQTTGPVQSSPAVAGGYIYMGLLDGRFVVLDRHTGELEWEYQTGNFITGSPIIFNGVAYVGSGDKFLYAFDAETGEVIWQKETNGRIYSTPVLKDGIVHVATDVHANFSFSAKTGALRLWYKSFRNLTDSPVVANGLVYFVTEKGELYAIDHEATDIPGTYQLDALRWQLWIMGFPVSRPSAQSGFKWNVTPNNKWRGFRSSPAATSEKLYIGDTIGFFYALKAKNGSRIWEFRADSAILTAPLVLGDRVYFGTVKGSLYALKQSDGQLIWRLSLSDAINTSPVYGSGLIFVRTIDRKLYAIK